MANITPEKMAEFFAKELIEDFERLERHLEELEERWCRYGDQYKNLLSDEIRDELEKNMMAIIGRLQAKSAEEG